MPAKPPPDFNPERYAAAYPDVGLSGLDPREHYLRFGKLMGRSPIGKGAATTAPAKGPAPRPVRSVAEPPSERSVEKVPAPLAKSPIVDRPPTFDPQEVFPRSAAERAGTSETGILQLAAFGDGQFASIEARESAAASLVAYARLMSLPPPVGLESASRGSNLFQEGASRIQSAWFAGPLKLRLMVGAPDVARSATANWVLRAYQAAPASPGELRSAGNGVQLPAQGPVLHDVELRHPLMPVLLELADAEGATQALALLPFPSLLPGGVHGAELKALQTEANPMDAFWALSGTLLEEAIGQAGWPDRSIRSLSFHDEGAGPAPSLAPEFQEWMSAVFGLPVPFSSAKEISDGLQLILPPHSVPTISALASRRLDLGTAAQSVGPFLVAEEVTKRPRWSVSLPADCNSRGEIPVLRRSGARKPSKARPKSIPIHLAIAAPRPACVAGAAVGAKAVSLPAGLPLTVVLRASDAARTDALLKPLREETGTTDLDLLVRMPIADEVRQTLDLAVGSDGWRAATGTDLRDLANEARNETLLTLDDRVKLENGRLLQVLAGLLERGDSIASMSCLLLGEAMVKKDVVLQPGCGGLFPARVSFASSPRLGFAEPDVTQALANLTYPVVANAFLLTLWQTRALADLPRPRGPIPSTAADIRIGLDLMEAGYRNFCTTTVQAVLSSPYKRRDAIDPVGGAYLQPARWEEILDRVTVIRELF